MTIFVDIDGTICSQEKNYADAKPYKHKITRINNLYKKGHIITYWTSRGGTSGIDWSELTKNQLQEWGCLYHELRFDKPFGVMVDNRIIHSTDLAFKQLTTFTGIYKIQSKYKPERKYIGSAVDYNDRKRCHLKDLRANKHHSPKLQRHYNKYGEDDLMFDLIIECSKCDLLIYEQFFLDAYNPFFNTCKIAGNTSGVKASLETRKKQSIAHKGIVGIWKGKKLSEEHRKNLSLSHKGRIAPWKGKHLTEETKRKMSISHKGRHLSRGTEFKKGHVNSEETRKKISIRLIGNKYASNDYKAKKL